jgi:hypothetical protein
MQMTMEAVCILTQEKPDWDTVRDDTVFAGLGSVMERFAGGELAFWSVEQFGAGASSTISSQCLPVSPVHCD